MRTSLGGFDDLAFPTAPWDLDGDDPEFRAVRAFLLDSELVDGLDENTLESPRLTPRSPQVADNTSSDSASPDSSEIRRPRKVNRSRQRLQAEIAALRQQAIALKHQLVRLQRGTRDVRSDAEDIMSLAWKTVAQGQRDARAAVETERERLRRRINDHKRYIRQARRVMQERMLHYLERGTRPEIHQLPGADSIVVQGFDQVSRKLSVMWQQLHENSAHHDVLVRLQEMYTEALLQVRDAWHVPFAADTMVEAAWLCHQYGTTRVPKRGDRDQVLGETSTLRRQFSKTHEFPSYTGRIHGITEARRFRIGDCHIIVHCALVATTNKADGYEFCNCQWTIISPVQTESAAIASSEVRVFEITLPVQPHQQVSNAQHAFCAEASTFMQQAERQQQENLCLDLALELR